jgi:hypothetical protein
MLVISNNGREIASTNYWQSEYARRGILYLSVNSGAFRLLLPKILEIALSDMKTAREAIISRGPWPDKNRADAIEVLFEDGSDKPFALLFGTEQIDRMPSVADEGRRGLECSVWSNGPSPVKALSLPAAYRRVKSLPCLEDL